MKAPRTHQHAVIAVGLGALILIGTQFCLVKRNRQIAFSRLQEFNDISLLELSDVRQKTVGRLIDDLGLKLIPDDDPWMSSQFRENWLVHMERSVASSPRMYIVVMLPTMFIPGRSYCWVHIVEHPGNLVRTQRFNVGYRAWPKAAKFDPRYGFVCLTVETYGMWSGETRQFYRITDSHIELIRSERLDGTLCMGNGNLFEIQDKPSDWSEWKRLLESSDRIEQLRGLAAFWSYDIQINLKTAVDEDVWNRLRELAKSSDQWIREESTTALEGTPLYPGSRP